MASLHLTNIAIDTIQKKMLLKLQRQIVKHIIKKCDLMDATGKKEINRRHFDSDEFKNVIQHNLLIIKQNFKGHSNLYDTRTKSYEFSVLKTLIKVTGIYTFKHRCTTTPDGRTSITYYWFNLI